MLRKFTSVVCAMLSCMLTFVACSDDADLPQPVPSEETPEVAISVEEIGERSIELVLSAKNAGHVACMHVLAAYADETPSALDVFRQNSFVSEVGDGEVRCRISGLEPGTSYVVYAAARMDETYGEVKKLEVATRSLENMLSFVESTKSTFTYRVDVPEGITYQHAYIEGWYYDYMLELSKRDAGPEFDMNVFLWNMLVDYGYEAEGPQDFFWYAGQDNPMRSDVAKIVGGKKYYALFSLYKAEGNWYGTPEAVPFETQPAGVSDATVTLIDEEITSDKVKVRMEVDSGKVLFFFYNLYSKTSFDEMKAAKGEAGMMDYLFEYGYSAANTYTDVWGVAPNTSYMFAVLGVDVDGDLFYLEKQFDSEPLQAGLTVDMRPFERELQGYHAYDTFEVLVSPVNFGEIRTDDVRWLIQPKSVLDDTLSMLGMTLEQLEQAPEYLAYVGGMPLPEDCAEQLAVKGSFVTYLSDMNPDTEYCYICAMPCGDTYKMAYATVATEAMPRPGVADDAYKALLGEWTLEGQSTEDYYTRKSYTLRFEELTPNRSYKVYGWSDSDIAQEFPFEVRYHTDTKRISIEGHQLLGTRTEDGVELQIFFEGFLAFNGDLQLADGFTGRAYSGMVDDGRLYMYPDFVQLSGRYYEFRTMAYAGYSPAEDIYYGFDRFQIVNFMVNSVSPQAYAVPLTFGAGTKTGVLSAVPWRPEASVRAAAPAVRDASVKQPAVFERR